MSKFLDPTFGTYLDWICKTFNVEPGSAAERMWGTLGMVATAFVLWAALQVFEHIMTITMKAKIKKMRREANENSFQKMLDLDFERSKDCNVLDLQQVRAGRRGNLLLQKRQDHL